MRLPPLFQRPDTFFDFSNVSKGCLKTPATQWCLKIPKIPHFNFFRTMRLFNFFDVISELYLSKEEAEVKKQTRYIRTSDAFSEHQWFPLDKAFGEVFLEKDPELISKTF